MEQIRTAVLYLCLTVVGLVLAEHILPVEKYAKQLRLMTAAILLTVLLKPLAGFRLPLLHAEQNPPESTVSELTGLAEQARDSAVSESLCCTLNQQMQANHVPCEVTAVSAHISEDGSIVISEITVSGDRLTGSVYLHEWLGSEVTVTEGGG